MTKRISILNAFETEKVLFVEPVASRYRLPAHSTAEIVSEHDMGDLELKYESGDYLTIWLDSGPDYRIVVSVNGTEIEPF